MCIYSSAPRLTCTELSRQWEEDHHEVDNLLDDSIVWSKMGVVIGLAALLHIVLAVCVALALLFLADQQFGRDSSEFYSSFFALVVWVLSQFQASYNSFDGALFLLSRMKRVVKRGMKSVLLAERFVHAFVQLHSRQQLLAASMLEAYSHAPPPASSPSATQSAATRLLPTSASNVSSSSASELQLEDISAPVASPQPQLDDLKSPAMRSDNPS